MTLFGRMLARALCAAGLVSMPLAMAQAAGALAIGACGAYGFAFDFAGDTVARNAALGKCEGQCKVVAALSRNCAAFAVDLRNACGFHAHATAARLRYLRRSGRKVPEAREELWRRARPANSTRQGPTRRLRRLQGEDRCHPLAGDRARL